MRGGMAIKEMLKAMSQPVETDVLLLQPQSGTNAVVAQIIVEITLLRCQVMQVHDQWLVFASPDGGVRIKGCPIHQERVNVAEPAAQLIQDAKTMGVDIAPVMD